MCTAQRMKCSPLLRCYRRCAHPRLQHSSACLLQRFAQVPALRSVHFSNSSIERLVAHSKFVACEADQVLCVEGEPARHVYGDVSHPFPSRPLPCFAGGHAPPCDRYIVLDGMLQLLRQRPQALKPPQAKKACAPPTPASPYANTRP